MHELGIVFHIADSIEAIAKENQLTQVSKVVIELGEVSGVVDHYLTDCWRWSADKSDLFKGSVMEIETVPAVTLCNDCNQTYQTLRYAKICPYCQSNNTHLVKGDEINIKEIEAC